LQFPDYIEAEIDSTDPLVPAFSELFGQSLLAQKFLQAGVTPLPRRAANLVQFAIQEDLESVSSLGGVGREGKIILKRCLALCRSTAVHGTMMPNSPANRQNRTDSASNSLRLTINTTTTGQARMPSAQNWPFQRKQAGH
jgi:hypothetical protein